MVHVEGLYGVKYYSVLLGSCTVAAFSLLFPKQNQSWCKIIKKVHINKYKNLQHILVITMSQLNDKRLYYFETNITVFYKDLNINQK